MASPNTYDVNQPIYIGGGGEGYRVLGMDLTSEVEPYLEDHPGNFYTHFEDRKVQDAIRRTHAAGQPVILIGHSWGGSDAIAAARWARSQNIPVDLLITADPVGLPRAHGGSSDQPIAKSWTSVIASKPSNEPGDRLARSWRKTPMAVQNGANSVINDTNSVHANFRKMMAAANAKQRIQEIYARRAPQ